MGKSAVNLKTSFAKKYDEIVALNCRAWLIKLLFFK